MSAAQQRLESFLSTPPRGGRHCTMQRPGPFPFVSIHAPTRGATCTAWCLSLTCTFLSTPPRGGRHLTAAALRVSRVVSIHAPTRGATCATFGGSQTVEFLSTPPRGGRPGEVCANPSVAGFYPRPHAGGDAHGGRVELGGQFLSTPPRGGRPAGGFQVFTGFGVSIHAPTRGATPYWYASDH